MATICSPRVCDPGIPVEIYLFQVLKLGADDQGPGHVLELVLQRTGGQVGLAESFFFVAGRAAQERAVEPIDQPFEIGIARRLERPANRDRAFRSTPGPLGAAPLNDRHVVAAGGAHFVARRAPTPAERRVLESRNARSSDFT